MPVKKPSNDWPAVLATGQPGVRKWNRLTAAERAAVDLTGGDFTKADLTRINLTKVKARKAVFSGANLTAARITGDLKHSRFDSADLTGADLEGADLLGADFTGAVLTGADFTSAVLIGAKLDAVGLGEAQWKGAAFDKDTVWPSGYVIPAEMRWTGRSTDPRLAGKGKKAVARDINGLLTRLNKSIDPKRMERTYSMLKKEKNQLFAEIEPTHIRGVVRSQSTDGIYACVLTADGSYACCSSDMGLCMGLRGEPCKHVLVLLIGLARAGEIEAAAVDPWVSVAIGRGHRWNKTTRNHLADVFLKYHGVVAGEIDWRPTETLPEDFYSL